MSERLSLKSVHLNFLWIAEMILAVFTFLMTVFFSYQSIGLIMSFDLTTNAGFYQLISRVLLILLGFELVRLTLSHDVATVLELVIIIGARKMLTPNLEAQEFLLVAVAISIVIGINILYRKYGR